jgi:hypothetical protein
MTLDQTVGDLQSTVMRRLPDSKNCKWHNFGLYLKPRNKRKSCGVWLESYKFLSTYKLDDQTMIEFRERYRHFTFELLIYPLEDWCRRFRIGDAIKPEENKKPLFHTIRFGVSEVASVNEVVEGIVSTW